VNFVFPCAISVGVTLLTGNALPLLYLYILLIEESQQWQMSAFLSFFFFYFFLLLTNGELRLW
jgi:hypothetical protein